jgi:segregation and condensation protein A
MDIFDLPIVPLCDQYMVHLRAMEAMDLHIAGEFFVMAATLLEIKSRMLLPKPPKEETNAEEAGDDPRMALVQKLIEYGRFQAIAETLQGREGERGNWFFRPQMPLSTEYRLPPRFGEMSATALLQALERMLAEVGAGERAVTSVRRQKVTLRMAMRRVLTQAEAAGAAGLSLAALLPEPPSELIEVVLLFLAVLELLKQGTIAVAQEAFAGEIFLFFIPEVMRDA